MQKAARKFKKYASTIDHDLQAIIFELIDTIHAKTVTLRKLMKLKHQIKLMSSLHHTNKTSDLLNGILKTPRLDRESSESVMESIREDIDKETFDEVTDILGKVSLSVIEEDIDKKLEDVSERIAVIENVNNELVKNKSNFKQPEIVVENAKSIVQEIVEKAETVIKKTQSKMNDSVTSKPLLNQEEITSSLPVAEVGTIYENPDQSEGNCHDLEEALNNIKSSKTNHTRVILDNETYNKMVHAIQSTFSKQINIGVRKKNENNIFSKPASSMNRERSQTPPGTNRAIDSSVARSSMSTVCLRKTRKKRS